MSTADSLVILPPKRRSKIPELIQQLTATLQGQHAQKTEQEDTRARALASQFGKLAPDVQRKLYAGLPSTVKRYVMDPNGIPEPELSDLEYREREAKAAKATTDQEEAMYRGDMIRGLPRDLGTGGRDAAYNITTGGHNPTANVSGANVAQTIYEDPNAFPREMVERQGIDDQRLPSWEQSNVTLPKSQSEIRENDATATNQLASAGAATELANVRRGEQDPDSPTTAAKVKVAAANETQKDPLKEFNTVLTKLSGDEAKAIAEVNAARAYSGVGKASKVAEAEAKLNAIRQMIGGWMERRDTAAAQLGLKRVQPGAKPAAPAPPRAAAPQQNVTFVTQQEYDTLIAMGETPKSIAADGIQLRK